MAQSDLNSAVEEVTMKQELTIEDIKKVIEKIAPKI